MGRSKIEAGILALGAVAAEPRFIEATALDRCAMCCFDEFLEKSRVPLLRHRVCRNSQWREFPSYVEALVEYVLLSKVDVLMSHRCNTGKCKDEVQRTYVAEFTVRSHFASHGCGSWRFGLLFAMSERGWLSHGTGRVIVRDHRSHYWK